MKREWSKYQLGIFDAYENSNKNIVINATAGSSKTTVLVELSNRTPSYKRSLFMAFNKSIAEELKTRLAANCECNTFHSKGLGVLRNAYKFTLVLNEDKGMCVAKEVLKLHKLSQKQVFPYLIAIQKIWNKLRLIASDGGYVEILAICEEEGILYEERMVDDIYILSEEWKKRAGRIQNNNAFQMDFTDMLWMPYYLVDEMQFPKYDVLYLDEAQDNMTIQSELSKRYLKPRGRMIIVGDTSQCIYGFIGGDKDNFENFMKQPNTITLPLSISYRCSKAIVKEANKVFENSIEAAPNAPEGEVKKEGDFRDAKEGDFILCRNNYPLIQAFLELTKIGKRSTIKGKEFGEELCKMLSGVSSMSDIESMLDDKYEKLQAKGLSLYQIENNASYAALKEKYDILEALSENIRGGFQGLVRSIQNIFSENIEGIMLSTIHKSKGLEAERVYFLNPELIPSKYATTEKALYAEQCLKFVAITRAKKELIYCTI